MSCKHSLHALTGAFCKPVCRLGMGSDSTLSSLQTGWRVAVCKMGGPGEVAFFLTLFTFLATTPDDHDSLLSSGVMMSPSYPDPYPEHTNHSQTIKVSKGNVVKIHFTDFSVELFDRVQLKDGDGTVLFHLGGNRKGSLRDITSNTETVHVLLQAEDRSYERNIWRRWSFAWSKYLCGHSF